MALTVTSSEGNQGMKAVPSWMGLMPLWEAWQPVCPLFPSIFSSMWKHLDKVPFLKTGPSSEIKSLPEACPWTSQTPVLWETHFCWLKMTCVKLFCNSSRNRQGSDTQQYSGICQLLLTLSLQQLSKMRSVNSLVQCRDQGDWLKGHCHSPVQQTATETPYTYIYMYNVYKMAWSWRIFVT